MWRNPLVSLVGLEPWIVCLLDFVSVYLFQSSWAGVFGFGESQKFLVVSSPATGRPYLSASRDNRSNRSCLVIDDIDGWKIKMFRKIGTAKLLQAPTQLTHGRLVLPRESWKRREVKIVEEADLNRLYTASMPQQVLTDRLFPNLFNWDVAYLKLPSDGSPATANGQVGQTGTFKLLTKTCFVVPDRQLIQRTILLCSFVNEKLRLWRRWFLQSCILSLLISWG